MAILNPENVRFMKSGTLIYYKDGTFVIIKTNLKWILGFFTMVPKSNNVHHTWTR
jgi:hypothetical protein